MIAFQLNSVTLNVFVRTCPHQRQIKYLQFGDYAHETRRAARVRWLLSSRCTAAKLGDPTMVSTEHK